MDEKSNKKLFMQELTNKAFNWELICKYFAAYITDVKALHH